VLHVHAMDMSSVLSCNHNLISPAY